MGCVNCRPRTRITSIVFGVYRTGRRMDGMMMYDIMMVVDGWDGKKKNERSFLTRKTTQHTQQTHELAIIFGLRKDEQTKYRALFFQCSATEQQQSEKH
jgi:hypothetical protein